MDNNQAVLGAWLHRSPTWELRTYFSWFARSHEVKHKNQWNFKPKCIKTRSTASTEFIRMNECGTPSISCSTFWILWAGCLEHIGEQPFALLNVPGRTGSSGQNCPHNTSASLLQPWLFPEKNYTWYLAIKWIVVISASRQYNNNWNQTLQTCINSEPTYKSSVTLAVCRVETESCLFPPFNLGSFSPLPPGWATSH